MKRVIRQPAPITEHMYSSSTDIHAVPFACVFNENYNYVASGDYIKRPVRSLLVKLNEIRAPAGMSAIFNVYRATSSLHINPAAARICF